MNSEIFKDIPSFEGYYQVSNLGRVKSCNRYLPNGRFHAEFIMKQQSNCKGYKTITLSKDGKAYHFLVHRLVALCFIPNKENKPQIDHINCDKADNRVENLRWCTNLENVIYCVNNNGRHIFTPTESSCSRMVAKLDLDGKELFVYPSLSEAHRQNPSASVSKISAVCRGERKKAGGFRWEFRSSSIKAFDKTEHKGVCIPILQYDINMNFVGEFKSITECHKKTNVHETCIRKSLRTKEPTWNGYYFLYKKE